MFKELIGQFKFYLVLSALLLCGLAVFVFLNKQPEIFGQFKEEALSEDLKLKVDKSKILTSEIRVEAIKTNEYIEEEKEWVEKKIGEKEVVYYEYISDTVATNKPYFQDSNIAKAEYLPKRKDGKEPIAFYAENKWYKDGDKIYEIKIGTTTKEAFESETKKTSFEKVLDFFIPTAIATTTATSTTTWTAPSAGTVEILLVGGGGGGGKSRNNDCGAGGGGAGGIVYNSSFAVTAKTYDVVVGTGGAGATVLDGTDGNHGSNGNDSVFDTLTAYGGGSGSGDGYGAAGPNIDGLDGGCGGGANRTGTGGTGSQGGDGGSINFCDGNGGGGAGENGSVDANGYGGDGTAYTISGSSVTYAGGGAGGIYGTGVAKVGGDGGGGTGGRAGLVGGSGTDNLGGGGGGGGTTSTLSGNGGNGGDGIVILVFTAGEAPAVTETRKPAQMQMLIY